MAPVIAMVMVMVLVLVIGGVFSVWFPRRTNSKLEIYSSP